MAVSRSMANSLMQSSLGGIPYIGPGTWYLGLCSVEPSATGVITGEPSTSSGYQRLAIPNNQQYFTQPVHDAEHPLTYITNAVRLEMNDITGGDSPPISYFFLSYTQSGGEASVWGKFDRDRVLYPNSTLFIEPYGIILEMVNIEISSGDSNIDSAGE